jgi:site-specific recombinase XerD
MTTQLKISFLLKRNKADETGKVPVYVRITIDSRRTEFSLKRKTDPKRWHKRAGKAVGNVEDVKSLNAHLEDVAGKLRQIYQRYCDLSETITPVRLKNEYFGKSERNKLLLKVFQDHNDQMKALIGKQYAPGTLERFETAYKHVKEFLQWQYAFDDIDIKKINHEFITNFEYFLKTVRSCSQNTAMKYISNLKKVVRRCVSNGWLQQDPFFNYRIRLEDVNREYLTWEEIDMLRNETLISKTLEQVRDVFVFCCFTGCAYVDVKKLTSDHITTNINGKKQLTLFRTKTNTRSAIPLLPQALEILKKYNGIGTISRRPFLLPVLSNQKMNEYLKVIGTVCKITKNLHFHLSRHTFAVTMLSVAGVPIETLSKMMGHKLIKTTQHYGKITDTKVSYDMNLAEQKLNDLTAQTEKSKRRKAK